MLRKGLITRTTLVSALAAVAALALVPGCGDDDAPGGGPPSGSDGGDASTTKSSVLLGASHSSTIALSNDDKRVVATNWDTESATVFSVEYAADAAPKLTKKVEIALGERPTSVAIHPSGDFAYVVVRRAQKLIRIDDLATDAPKKGPEVKVGSEPTGVALTPTGATAWVANNVDGTLMGIDTATMAVTETINLNDTVASSGLMGTVKSRPSLAHPRGIAITNNGDGTDTDESIFVTDYLPVQTEPIKPDGLNYDTSRSGLVYKIPLATKTAKIIQIPPLMKTGFRDSNGAEHGCSLTQLENITIHGAFGYVSALCMTVQGPALVFYGPPFAECTTDAQCPGGAAGSCSAGACTTNCTTNDECGYKGVCNANLCDINAESPKAAVNAVVSIIDLGGDKTVGTANLNSFFWDYYDKNKTPDNALRRVPSYPVDVGLIPGTTQAFFVGRSVDALFRVDFNATYQTALIDSVGDPRGQKDFIDLAPGGVEPGLQGHIPTGIAVAANPHEAPSGGTTTRYAVVNNLTSRNVSMIDLTTQEIVGISVGRPVVAESSPQPTDPVQIDTLSGEFLFHTALTRWSHKGQGWYGGCHGCHGDMQSDASPWIFTGPHKAPRLTGSFSSTDPDFEKVQDAIADLDELEDDDFAFQFLQGWVGAIISEDKNDPAVAIPYYLYGQYGLVGCARCAADTTNPAGMPVANVVKDWDKMRLWTREIRTPKRPSTLDPAKVAAGRQLFLEGNCQGCHGGPKWTIGQRFYKPEVTGQLSTALQRTSWADDVARSGFPLDLLPTRNRDIATMRSAESVVAALYYEDLLVCLLRDVGTFNVAEQGMGIADLDADMASPGLGGKTYKGFLPTSLLGLPTAGAMFHATQARTIEATFNEEFSKHFRGLNRNFLAANDPERATKIENLVQFLLAIDDDEPTIPIPPLGPKGGSFCRVPKF